jgi:hypothetical protein
MHVARLALVLVPMALVAPLAACTSSAPAAPDPASPGVTFQGSATDAALTAMLALQPSDDPALAAYFDTPKNLSELPATPVATFTWHDGQASAMRLLPRPAKRGSFTGVLADLLGEGTARAQGPAMSGPGYLLAFSVLDTGEALFRVFTSATSYTPDAASWAKVATGNWTQLQITSATFTDDEVAANGGPYSGQVIKFCVGTWQQ